VVTLPSVSKVGSRSPADPKATPVHVIRSTVDTIVLSRTWAKRDGRPVLVIALTPPR
jgi:hypothetical protein